MGSYQQSVIASRSLSAKLSVGLLVGICTPGQLTATWQEYLGIHISFTITFVRTKTPSCPITLSLCIESMNVTFPLKKYHLYYIWHPTHQQKYSHSNLDHLFHKQQKVRITYISTLEQCLREVRYWKGRCISYENHQGFCTQQPNR